MSLDLTLRASRYALVQHNSKKQPTRNAPPVFTHLKEVAWLTWHSGGTPTEIAAAWLHESVKETSTTRNDIRIQFGLPVYNLVDGLTDPPDFANMPLPDRKHAQAIRLGTYPACRRVKLADETSNVSMVTYDPPPEWDAAMRIAYIEGAGRIAHACRGASPRLDKVFRRVFDDAVSRLS